MRRRWATLSAAVTGISFVVLFLLVHSVNDRPLRIDRWATNLATSHRPGWAVHVARTVTALGTPIVVYPVLIAVTAAATAYRRRWWMVAAPVVLFAAQTFRRLIADAVERPRPPSRLHLTGSSGWSFPSGHTTLATTGLGLAAVVALMSLPSGTSRRAATAWIGLGAAILAAGVGLSRVELGVHWLTDVIGGWLLGGFVLAVVVAVIPAAGQWVSDDQ